MWWNSNLTMFKEMIGRSGSFQLLPKYVSLIREFKDINLKHVYMNRWHLDLQQVIQGEIKYGQKSGVGIYIQIDLSMLANLNLTPLLNSIKNQIAYCGKFTLSWFG